MQKTRVGQTALLAATVFAGLLVASNSVQAQNTATANVTAEVQQPIVVTKLTDLDFGNVFPGVDKTVPVTAAEAASFEIAGQASSQVNITFTLPADLTDGGTETMPVTTWTGTTNTTASPSGGSTFTPSASAETTTLSSTGGLFVYVGATAEPAIDQAAGTYTGTLTVTVVYF